MAVIGLWRGWCGWSGEMARCLMLSERDAERSVCRGDEGLMPCGAFLGLMARYLPSIWEEVVGREEGNPTDCFHGLVKTRFHFSALCSSRSSVSWGNAPNLGPAKWTSAVGSCG